MQSRKSLPSSYVEKHQEDVFEYKISVFTNVVGNNVRPDV
jgi:hypothetical protein